MTKTYANPKLNMMPISIFFRAGSCRAQIPGSGIIAMAKSKAMLIAADEISLATTLAHFPSIVLSQMHANGRQYNRLAKTNATQKDRAMLPTMRDEILM